VVWVKKSLRRKGNWQKGGMEKKVSVLTGKGGGRGGKKKQTLGGKGLDGCKTLLLKEGIKKRGKWKGQKKERENRGEGGSS